MSANFLPGGAPEIVPERIVEACDRGRSRIVKFGPEALLCPRRLGQNALLSCVTWPGRTFRC